MSFLSLVAELGINTSPFQRGLDNARGYAAKFGADVGSNLKQRMAGIFTAAAIAEGVRRLLDYTDRVSDLAERFELTTDQIQAFDFAAKLNGTTIEKIGTALTKIRAAQGNSTMADEFQALGFSLREINSLDPSGVLARIGEKLKHGELSAREFSAALKVMGESANEIFPALRKGLDESKGFFQAAGLVIPAETIESLGRYNDGLDIAKAVTKRIGAELVDMPLKLSDAWAEVSAAVLLALDAVDSGYNNQSYFEEAGAGAIEKFKNAWNKVTSMSSFGSTLHIDSLADSTKLQEQLEARLRMSQAKRRDQDTAKAEEERKTTEDQLKLKDKLKSVQFQLMSDDERRIALQRELVAAQQDYWEATKGSTDELKAQIRYAEAMQGLKSLPKESVHVSPIQADRLAQIGSFIGGAAGLNTSDNIPRAQLRILQSIDERLAQSKPMFFGY